MFIFDLALFEFRTYKEQLISFVPGINVLLGRNGVGKTNVLEAISYLSKLSSHRVSSDQNVIKENENRAVVQTRVGVETPEYLIEVEINNRGGKKYRVNKNSVKAKEIIGILQTVLFSPEDIDLVKGDPANRRSYLDEICVQIRPHFAEIKNNYDKVLRQRSSYLKQIVKQYSLGKILIALETNKINEELNSAFMMLDIWDIQLAKAGAQIISERMAAIFKLRPHVLAAYNQVATENNLARIDYLSSLEKAENLVINNAHEINSDIEKEKEREKQEQKLMQVEIVESRFLQALKASRSEEIARGLCLIGPHRDDLRLCLQNFPAKGYASHGESWSYALALRLAQWQILRKERLKNQENENSEIEFALDDPVILLDDVFAEIDEERREKIGNLIKNADQVIITAAVKEDLPKSLELQNETKILKVEKGKIL